MVRLRCLVGVLLERADLWIQKRDIPVLKQTVKPKMIDRVHSVPGQTCNDM